MRTLWLCRGKRHPLIETIWRTGCWRLRSEHGMVLPAGCSQLGCIPHEFTEALCAQDPNFWIDREGSTLCNAHARRARESDRANGLAKRRPAGWVVLSPRYYQLTLEMG